MISTSVHAHLLGASFDRLPALLRGVHDARTLKRFCGRCSIDTGGGWLSRIIRRLASLPDAQHDVPVSVIIERNEAREMSEIREIWTRRFGDHRMRSTIRARSGLEERFGPVVLTFELIAEGERVVWRLQRARFLFLPLPASWFSGCAAVEAVADGRYWFDACAQIRGVGLLVHYRGWLAEHVG